VLLLMDEPAFAGCIVSARLIGVIEAEQTEESGTVRNDRFIAVIETKSNPAEYRSIDELSKQRVDEFEHFFVAYNDMVGKRFKPLARHGAERALALLTKAIDSERQKAVKK